MKKLIITALILLSYQADAQIKAVTDEGKEVVLFDNGTWKFVNESDAAVLETITTNDKLFIKDNNATFLFRSKRLNSGLYVNPKVWKITDAFKAPFLEFAFINSNNYNIYGIFTSENVEIATLKNLKDILIGTVQSRADYFKLKECEYRTVNGLKVIYINYMANSKGMDFEYMTYAFLNENGYCTVSSYCASKSFEQLKPEMEKFINGLVETKKTETVEVYETPPPPPAKIKSKN